MNRLLIFIFVAILFIGCKTGPEAIKLNQDNCAFCKMSISDAKFATEVVTDKGRVYKFDDLHCMLGFVKADANFKGTLYAVPAEDEKTFVVAKEAFYVKSDAIKSPMEGHTLAYKSKQAAEVAAKGYEVEIMDWPGISK